MTLAKQIAERARDKGMISDKQQFFSVTDKKKVDAGGVMVDVEVPNGMHRIKIVSQKMGKGKGYDGQEQDELQMEITDNGSPKIWNMPVKNKDGTLYYLIEDLEHIELNEEFFVEAFKMKNGHYGKRISKVAGGDSVPNIQLDEPTREEDRPSLDGGQDIPPDELPF